MQVLEMEEVESLVSNANRKRLGDINGPAKKRKAGILSAAISCVRRGDTLPKVVVVACVILLGLLYISSQEEVDGVIDVESKDPVLSDGVPSVDENIQSPFSTPVEVPSKQDDVSPSSPPQPDPTDSPTLPPTLSPTLNPTPIPVNENSVEQNDSKPDEDNNNAFLYSKYATVLPLVDHPLPNEDEKEAVTEKFGKWGFYDGDEDERPMEDYTAKYPNRDMPGNEFADDAWQADAVYVNHILNDADLLISRTMEAIFVEYGHGKPLPPEGLGERMKMFHWSKENLSEENAQPPEKYRKRGNRGNGGWTTQRSFDGLVRRLLHAMMTQDTFTVVMGGHSAAQGQGNHFRQSYMMQFHKVMYPIFARLGVKLITRNVGQGGLGTIQAGMGSGSIYGDEVDLLMWDSGMTERSNEYTDVFYRQALLAGNRVPVIWGGPFELLKMLHEEADVDVGDWGTALDGIEEVVSLEQAKSLPWAARFLKCAEGAEDLCKEEPRFCAKCWIDRDDNIVPKEKQLDHPKGQVKWHPGWRNHQLMGRNLAFAMLEALQAAINIWTEGVMGGPPLDDDAWHVSDYYENIRNKVKNLDKSLGSCYKLEGTLPTRLCNTPMKAKTQYTPRSNFYDTALTSIIKPTTDGYVPENKNTMLYDGPDAHNTCFDIPEGEVDVFNVATGRRQLVELDFQVQSQTIVESDSLGEGALLNANIPRHLEDSITPGKGWEVHGEPPGLCDGTYNVTCGRSTESDCVLYGHHDGRGAVIGNEFSGWLVMNLKDLKEGVIILKLHTWHTEDEKSIAQDIDPDGRQRRQLRQTSQVKANKEHHEIVDRMLTRDYNTPDLPDEFVFEYAIDGKITTLTKDQFLEEKKQIDRVVETITILDDPNFTSETKDIEIAIRLRGSGKAIVFGVSHVYWA